MTLARTVTLTEFSTRIGNFVPELRTAYVRGFQRAALRLNAYTVEEIDTAQPYPAVDTGELRSSVDTTFVDDGAIVTVDAPHAGILEYGTRPFTPPLAPLVEWVKRKGFSRPSKTFGPQTQRQTTLRSTLAQYRREARASGLGAREARVSAEDRMATEIARAIQRKISQRGIAPRGYFAKAWGRMLADLQRDVHVEIAKLGR